MEYVATNGTIYFPTPPAAPVPPPFFGGCTATPNFMTHSHSPITLAPQYGGSNVIISHLGYGSGMVGGLQGLVKALEAGGMSSGSIRVSPRTPPSVPKSKVAPATYPLISIHGKWNRVRVSSVRTYAIVLALGILIGVGVGYYMGNSQGFDSMVEKVK